MVRGSGFSRDLSMDSTLTFPCDLAIKIFGRNARKLRGTALAIVRTHCPEVADDAVVERVSREGTYLSLTITARIESRVQADAVYSALSAHDEILMVL
jgi:putative lipoic acid-binding regulatory protein